MNAAMIWQKNIFLQITRAVRLPLMAHVQAALAQHWSLDPSITFLNHGSFGACPKSVLAAQRDLIARMEAEPVVFLARELEARLDAARGELAAFLGAEADDVVFVPNATAGVNTVLRSLRYAPGDELLVTDHAYNACKNALHFAAERDGAKATVARVPFPVKSPGEISAVVLSAVTSRTKIVLLDHVTNPTALIFPVEDIVRELLKRGIDTLVDGAHAPGMIPLNVAQIGAAYYTGNCHKWICAPKGAGFLHVRRDKQREIRPLSISHGANSTRTDRSRFQIEFNWTGTDDFTPYLCIADALKAMNALVPGGWAEIRRRNHALAVEAREILCGALNVAAPCPPEMIGSMATVPLPDASAYALTAAFTDPLQDELLFKHKVEVPLVNWGSFSRMVRVSAQLYNQRSDYEKLAAALDAALKK